MSQENQDEEGSDNSNEDDEAVNDDQQDMEEDDDDPNGDDDNDDNDDDDDDDDDEDDDDDDNLDAVEIPIGADGLPLGHEEMEEEEDEFDYGEEEMELDIMAGGDNQEFRARVRLNPPGRADQRNHDIINAPRDANPSYSIRDLDWDIGR